MKETKYAGTQTEKNLMAAFAGESEARNKYTYFASKAKKEGFEQIAQQMEQVAAIEKEHETRYRKLWENIQTQQVFARGSEVTWICGNCGHEVKGTDAPEICPVCHHAQGYFRIKAENY